ncbi:MAG TPA: ATP-binding domain-containing protein, partial [Chitinophagales bacterium]|nr:ATP-binding domain-containing protein [Chitinophagales bacterium]
LLDKPDFSEINQQSLNCVQSIKDKLFNSLRFHSGNQINILENKDKLPSITNLILNNIDGHILSFSNEESQKVNTWIKKSIIKTGEDIATKDLVLFNNNISVENENDPFAEPKKIYNGQFATVVEVSQNIIPETIKIKQEQTTINFRELTLRLNETGHKVKVLSLENYRLNPKAELSKNEIIAFKVILNAQISRYIKENPFEKSAEYKELVSSNTYQTTLKEIDELNQKLQQGEKVKGKLEEKEIEQRKLLRKAKRKHRLKIESNLRKDPTTKYHKYKNAALLRFGWAMTVHKSMSYKWNEVFFNVETGGGRNNENYFRWLYTGISRAKQKVNLINYKPINPFENTQIRDQNTGVRPQDIFYRSENTEPELRLTELKEFVTAKLSTHTIRNVEHYNWQERYFIINGNDQEAIISFSYNGQGVFRLPTVIGGNAELASNVIETLNHKTELKTFEVVKDVWRKREYEKLKIALSVYEIKFELILQTNWKDKIRFFSGESELEIELDYGGDGMVSYITAKYYNNEKIWGNFKKAVDTLK